MIAALAVAIVVLAGGVVALALRYASISSRVTSLALEVTTTERRASAADVQAATAISERDAAIAARDDTNHKTALQGKAWAEERRELVGQLDQLVVDAQTCSALVAELGEKVPGAVRSQVDAMMSHATPRESR